MPLARSLCLIVLIAAIDQMLYQEIMFDDPNNQYDEHSGLTTLFKVFLETDINN